MNLAGMKKLKNRQDKTYQHTGTAVVTFGIQGILAVPILPKVVKVGRIIKWKFECRCDWTVGLAVLLRTELSKICLDAAKISACFNFWLAYQQ